MIGKRNLTSTNYLSTYRYRSLPKNLSKCDKFHVIYVVKHLRLMLKTKNIGQVHAGIDGKAKTDSPI